jgi:hypothetical protein
MKPDGHKPTPSDVCGRGEGLAKQMHSAQQGNKHRCSKHTCVALKGEKKSHRALRHAAATSARAFMPAQMGRLVTTAQTNKAQPLLICFVCVSFSLFLRLSVSCFFHCAVKIASAYHLSFPSHPPTEEIHACRYHPSILSHFTPQRHTWHISDPADQRQAQLRAPRRQAVVRVDTRRSAHHVQRAA